MSDKPEISGEIAGGAALIILIAVITRLKTKGIFSDEDIRDLFEETSLGLEQGGLHDPGEEEMHTTLLQIQAMICSRLPPRSP